MATTHIYVPGKIMWAKGLNIIDKEYGTYNAQLIVDEAQKNTLVNAGCQAEFKAKDGNFLFKIKKDSTRIIYDPETKEKRTVDASPPEVFLTSPEGQRIDLDPKTVGNESDVTAKLELYDTRKGGKGTRLLSVRVENLIEYKPVEVIGADNMGEPF